MGEVLSRALAAAVALVPGIVANWRGRTLVRLIDDPALPERLISSRRRLAPVTTVVFALLIAFWPGDLWWAVPIAIVGRLAAAYPMRRALFGETWNLFAYLSFFVRLIVGVYGFWLLILLAPVILFESGSHVWWVGTVVGTLIVLGNVYAGGFIRRLLRSRPIDHPALAARFAQLVETAGLPMPRFERVDLHGGVFANAVALPSLRGSSVLVSETLLDRLEDDEVLGIAAHELAHLEHYDRRRLRRMAITTAVFSAIALVLPFALLKFAPSIPASLVLFWAVPLIVMLGLRARNRQQHETASDLRAVALTGNPEALVRALTKLHAIARVPRRWDAEVERHATHPSLARRIQAIRAAAGTPDAMLGESAPFAAASGPSSVTFHDDRLVWRESDKSAHTIGYDDLEQLRVRPAKSGEAELIAVDRGGRQWEMPLASADLARAQSVLDVVDTRLARPAARSRVSPMIVRMLALIAAAAALMVNHVAVALVAVLAAIRSDRVMAVAMAVAAAVGAGVLARDLGQQTGTLAALVALMLAACAAGLLLSVFLSRHEPSRPSSYRFVNALGIIALLSWIPIVASGVSAIALHQTARVWPAAAVLSLSFAVANLRRPNQSARLVSIAATAAGLFAAVAGSTLFLDYAGRDSFLRPAPSIAMRTVKVETQRSFPVDFTVSDLRISPGGRAVLLSSMDNEDRRTVHVGLAGQTLASFEMEDGVFLDDHRVLLLETPREGSVLREIDLDAGNEVMWEQRVIGLTATRLLLDASGERWQILGYDRKRITASASGRVGSGEVEQHQWDVGKSQDVWRRALTASANDAIVLETDYHPRLFDSLSWELAMFVEPSERTSSRLFAVSGAGSTEIATSHLALSCEVSPALGEAPLCASFDGTRTRLFTIDPATHAITPRALLPSQFLLFHADVSGWAIGWWRGSAVAINAGTEARDAVRFAEVDGLEIGQVTIAGQQVGAVVTSAPRSMVRIGDWR